MLGAWLYGGLLRRRGLRLRVHGRLHATRRRPTPTAAPAGPRPPTRSSGRSTRWRASSASTRSSCGGKNFIPRVPDARSRPGSRSTRATTPRRSTRRSTMVDYDDVRARAGGAPRARRHQAARDRLLDLRRDVRPRALADPRRDPYVAGGWDAATIRFLPTGTVQVLDRHLTARSGPRDDVLADRGRPARRADRGRRGAPRRHEVVPLGMDTYGSRSLTVGGVALYRRRSKVVAKAKDDRGPPVRGGRGRPRVRRTARSRSRAPTSRSTSRPRSPPGRRTTCRTGWSPGSRRRAVYDPPNFSGPAARTSRSSRSTRRPARSTSSATSRSTTVGVVVNPDDRRRPGRTAASRRASRRRSSRRRSTTTRQPAARRTWSPTWCRRPPELPELRARPHGDARHGQPARREGRGGDGHDRLSARGDERPRRRALSLRRLRHRDARHPGAGLARDWRRQR